jgi:hypothetical protein
MKEPQRIPLDPTTPKVKNVKTIPMPALHPNEEETAASFWKFIAKHKESRENWIKRNNEDNQEGHKT